MRRVAGGALVALAASCAPPPPAATSETGSPPDPIAFFAGPSHGEGMLNPLFGRSRRVAVTSVGRIAKDGSLVLDQRIVVAGKPPRTRRWTMHKVGGGRWTGTLTDADGPVAVEGQGRALAIRYRTRGLAVEQWLVATGPGTLRNRMTFRKAGITLARLDETIRRD